MSDGLEIVATGVDEVSGVFDNIATGISIAFGEKLLNAVGGAFTFINDQLNSFIESASYSEDVMTLFNATIEKSPLKEYKQQLLDLAEAKKLVTKFDDEEIISAEQVLSKYGNLGDKIVDVTKLTLDFATLQKMDATSAANMLGKALEDIGGGSLSLLGRTKLLTAEQREHAKAMAENGKVAEAQTYIIDILNNKVGGLAEEMGKTYSGKLKIFNNTLDDLKETLGGPLLEVLKPVLDKFQQLAMVYAPIIAQVFNQYVVPAFSSTVGWLLKMADVFQGKGLGGMLEQFSHDFANLAINISNWITRMDWKKISKDLAEGINKIDWQQASENFSAGGKAIFDALGYAIQQIDWGAIALAVGNAFMSAVAGTMTVNGQQANWNKIKQTWIDVMAEIGKNSAGTYVKYFLDGIVAGIKAGIKAALTSAIANVKTGTGTRAGSLTGRASGGDAEGPTLVGEEGPEIVDLPGGSHVYSNSDSKKIGMGANITINVNGPIVGTDERQVALILRPAVLQVMREFGAA